jgi:DNA mismatch repair protein MutL
VAAVAQVELKTRRVEDPVGHRVCVEGGEITTNEPCATPPGTSVAVRNLFYNVPARRNFLKTPATEFKHLTDTFQFIALAEPTVAFTLEHKGHTVYRLDAISADDFHARTAQRVIDLLGEEHEGQLIPVEAQSSYLTVRGLIGKPAFNRKRRGDQFLFVNNRYVKSRYLSHAVRAAYGELLPEGAFPFFALFLDLDPRRVDVNVHPTKAEVKFEDESGIYGLLREAVREGLSRDQLTPAFDSSESDASETASAPSSSSSEDAVDTTRNATPRPFQPRSSERATSHLSSTAPGGSRSSSRAVPAASSPPPGEVSQALYDQGKQAASQDAAAPRAHRGDDRPVWALHGTYLITPTDEGMLLVDQRAAHVRVLYERALDRAQAGRAESQQLLFPHTLDLSPADLELLDEWEDDLHAMGFEVERLSGRTVAVRAVPADVRRSDESTLLPDLLADIESGVPDASDRRKALAARLARQQAVSRGHPLSEPEQRALLNDLFACEMPYADPQGNPTVLRLSLDEIEQAFRR